MSSEARPKIEPRPVVPVTCADCGSALGQVRIRLLPWWAHPGRDSVCLRQWGWDDVEPAAPGAPRRPLLPNGVEVDEHALQLDQRLLWQCRRCRTVVGTDLHELWQQYDDVVGRWYSDARNRRAHNLRVEPLRVRKLF